MAGPTILSLCSGIGGLELGVRAVFPASRVVGYVERDAFAAAVLLARMEAADLEPAPVWCGNLEELDPAPFLGVDLVCAGFPCQPFSVAGKRNGTEDERWIWPAIADIVRKVGCRYVFLENVPGLVQHGMPHVLGSLAELGFDAEWGLFSASEVGAPHRRLRWFCVAHRDSPGRGQLGGSGLLHGERATRRDDPDRCGKDVGHPDLEGLEGRGLRGCRRAHQRPAWPPSPADTEGWRRWDGPQPAVRRDADGLPDRVDRLRCLGNAVVPQQAALALRILMERITCPSHPNTKPGKSPRTNTHPGPA